MDPNAFGSRLRSLIPKAARDAPLPALIRIAGPFAAEPLALIPPGSASQDGGRTWDLPKGSVWFRASLMTPEAPALAYAGITIGSGTLTLDQPAALVNNTLYSSGNFVI